MSRTGARGRVRRYPSIGRRSASALAVAVLVAAGVAGCGGSSSSSSIAGSTSTKSTTTALPPVAKPPPNAEEGTVFVSLGSVAGLGQVLVDSEGHTLYTFTNTSGEEPTCETPCEKSWPPLLVAHGAPHPSNGTSASRLGTTTRADGSRQVTYARQPLYTYVGDKQPGEANGNGLKDSGLNWIALKGSGAPAG